MHLVVFIAFLVILPLWSAVKRQMYYLGSIPDPFCVLKEEIQEGMHTTLCHRLIKVSAPWRPRHHRDITPRGLVTSRWTSRSNQPLTPDGTEDNRSPCTVLKTHHSHWGRSASCNSPGQSSRQWHNKQWSVTVTFKIKSMRNLSQNREACFQKGLEDSSQMFILSSHISCRPQQGSCLIHSLLLPQECCPISLAGSVDHSYCRVPFLVVFARKLGGSYYY